MKFRPMFMAWASPGMPNRSVVEACQVMLDNFPEAPSVPQLSMSLEKRLKGLPCLNFDRERNEAFFDFSAAREDELIEFYQRYLSEDLDYFAVSPELDPALYKLEQMLKENPKPQLKFIHSAVRGPYTTGLTIKNERGAPAFYNDTMRDIIIKQLAMQIRWREKKIKELFPGVQTLFHIGEAGLGVYGSAIGTGSWVVIKNAINEVLEAVNGITGIHCCANADWSLLMDTNVDIINFDAYQYGDTMSLYPDALKRFLKRDGMIAWGIVPTTAAGDIESENPNSLEERLEQVIKLVVNRGIDKRILLESSWISPTCSTSSMSIELSDRVHSITREVSERMRKKHFG